MKNEVSAGGVVYKKDSGSLQILVARHSGHHGWVFPKGWVDEGETKEQAAVREVREEGGIEAHIIAPLRSVTYFYQWKGEKIRKTVHYFVMEYVSGKIEDHDWEMEEVEWLPMGEVEKRLTYTTDKKVFQEAKQYLEQVKT